jgi:hypothetical protein
LGKTPSTLPPTARPPASASLAQLTAPPEKKQPHLPRFPDEDLGERLFAEGLLDSFCVPQEKLLAAVKETKDYARERLSPTTTRAT